MALKGNELARDLEVLTTVGEAGLVGNQVSMANHLNHLQKFGPSRFLMLSNVLFQNIENLIWNRFYFGTQ